MPRSGNVTGRPWAMSRIRDWLDSSEPTLLITGPAGTGKSSLLAALRAPLGPNEVQPAATHHCQAHVTSSIDPVRILANVAAQLARTLPGYGPLLRPPRISDERARPAMRTVLDAIDPHRSFDQILRHPLEVLASTNRLTDDVVVVVDGLDEGPTESHAALADHFAASRDNPVPGLRLLFAARTGSVADRLRGSADFDLRADCPAGVDDVYEYLSATTTLPRRDRLAVAAAASGCYLYASVATQFGLVGAVSSPQMGAANVDTLYGRLLGADRFGRRVLSLLGRGRDHGFTPAHVAEFLEAPPERVVNVLSRWAGLLANRRRLHHRCLAEYLSATTDDGVDEYDWLIAQRLTARWSGRWQSCRAPAELRNLLPHLSDVAATTTDAERRAMAAEASVNIVSDPRFLTAALARVGVDDLLSALTYTRSRLPEVEQLATVAQVMRCQAKSLRLAREEGDTALVAQQLMYEASAIGAHELSRSLVNQVGSGVLTLWATVDSPSPVEPAAVPGHAGQVTDIVTTAAGTHAVTASDDGTLRVWMLASGRLDTVLDPMPDVAAPDSSPHTHVTNDQPVTASSLEATGANDRHDGSMTAFAVHPDSTTWVSGHANGDAVVWDLATGELIHRLPSRSSEVTAVAVSADGLTAATGSLSGDVAVWDTRTGTAVIRFTRPTTITALALTPEADRVIVGCDLALTVHPIAASQPGRPVASLYTRDRVTAAAVNPVMPRYLLFGTALGQVAYVRLP